MREQTVRVDKWRTSSYSGGSGTACVQVGALRWKRTVAARDSKDPSGPVLTFGPGEWRAFLDDVKRGAHDL
ncbi:hypothetical protein GCM10009527_024610 [Actinomadura nitritigenes]|uniref:DUF397 domain-containing protein n=1 Tax=Actinomadura nitritigenes TaxID=134602 RepID=A0ABS3QZU8_9ACTN|nr:DUF397 domain-containing protein [Actinomadura nitritigenes]MBO2439518.1 DUF397 domain-containing protein [Actinomadura nitritigenes]